MSTWLKRLFWFLIIVFILIGGIVGFYWFQSQTAQYLDLQLKGPERVLLGVPFDLRVDISNASNSVLKDAKLSLSLPEGAVFWGSPIEKTVDYRSLGNLGIGSLTQEIFKIVILNGENTIKRFPVSVGFLPMALGSRFEKSQALDVAVGEPGIALDLVMPEKIYSGEKFNALISVKNISGIDFSNLKLEAEYPPSFNFAEASLKPDVGNSIWNLGDLRKGSETNFTIKGNVVGPDNAFFDFKINLKVNYEGQTYTINGKSASLLIAQSPLSLQLSLNDDPNYIAGPGSVLNYMLYYTNNTDVGLKDAVIKAQLIGEMFDLATIGSKASFRSIDNTLTWNAANAPELALLPPGTSGSVIFRVNVKDKFPIKRLGDKNFMLKIESKIESLTVPYFVAAAKTIGLAKLETKVSGQVDIDTRVLFRDAASGILNKGSMPLKINTPTNFTVHWLITNFATDIQNVEIKAFLAGNVKFTGVAQSNIGVLPVYNERTQEMTWIINRIQATKGVIDKPVEAIFQIEAIPSSDMVNKYMPLIGETSIKAIDGFTGLELTDSDMAITTSLPDDSTVGGQGGIVR